MKGGNVGTVRVGIVGAGGIARQHAIAWRANEPRGRLAALADISPERARILADEFTGGAAKIYGTVEELVADPDIDVVDVCLPHDLHAAAIVKAARAGKAVLCEKPLCTTMVDAELIHNVLEETGVPFMMAHNQLFQPSLIEARKLLALGTIGRPFVIRSIECFQNAGALMGTQGKHDLAPGENPWTWRADLTRMGGGELLDTGWHATYRLLALANERPTEVSAITERFLIPGLPAEDTGFVNVRFESGAIGQILTTWAFSTPGNTQFEVMGELGSLAGASESITHQLHGWAQAAVKPVPGTHTFSAEVTHFLDVIQNGAESLATFATGARVLQIIKAAYKSSVERRTVSLPEDAFIEA
jgi:predicted dehydrogenase